jgi:hypothetical protein
VAAPDESVSLEENTVHWTAVCPAARRQGVRARASAPSANWGAHLASARGLQAAICQVDGSSFASPFRYLAPVTLATLRGYRDWDSRLNVGTAAAVK